MKSNLKGGNAVVRLLLAHGEKIGIAAILICAGLLIYSAINVPRMDAGRDPETLRTNANSAKQKIEAFTYESIAQQLDPSTPPEESPLVKVQPIDISKMKPLEASHFPTMAPVNPHVVPPMAPRTDPVLLAPEELEVHGDAGLWASADPAAIKQRQLAALKEAQKEQAAAEAERRRDDDDGDDRGRGRRRGRDRGRDDDDDEQQRGRNATIVMQPRTGVELSGFETITARSWVTVLARVPYKAQTQMYDDALKTARGYEPMRDIPQYIGYVVERAEVTPAGQGKWEEIALVHEKILVKELSTYPVNPPEVVASRFVHPLLTHPLPPLILKEWGERVSHSSMPLATEDIPPAEQEMIDAEKAADEPAEPATDDGGFGGARREPPVGGGAYGERGGYGGEMGGEYGGGRGGRGRGGYGGEYGGRGGGYGGEMGGEYGGRGGYGGGYGSLGRGADVQLAEFSWDGKTESVLLRFFDNSVEPGHSYRYRVRLAVKDVNDNVPVATLDKAVTERRSDIKENMRYYRLTDWSKASPIASVPLPARTYVMAAEAPTEAFNAQPEVEMLIKALNARFAAEIALPEKFLRGMVMNVRDKAKILWSNKYDEEKDPEFDFYTGVTVADIQGGEDLSSKNRDLTAPARVMLMDAAGKLQVHRELQDQSTVKDFNAALEAPRDGDGRGGYGGEYGGRGGRGGRGRGGY
jgi:hypothetical protein